MAKISLFDGSLEMTAEDFMSSMEKEVYLVPFENSQAERVYPVETRVEDGYLFVHMSDDTTFKIQVTRHR
jgi:hypothetical protein